MLHRKRLNVFFFF